jgi:hypothetical protein
VLWPHKTATNPPGFSSRNTKNSLYCIKGWKEHSIIIIKLITPQALSLKVPTNYLNTYSNGTIVPMLSRVKFYEVPTGVGQYWCSKSRSRFKSIDPPLSKWAAVAKRIYASGRKQKGAPSNQAVIRRSSIWTSEMQGMIKPYI